MNFVRAHGENSREESSNIYANLFAYGTVHFPLPEHQAEAEADLYYKYEKSHPKPEEKLCLDNILYAIRKISGIMTPQYQFPEKSRQEAIQQGIPLDGEGYLILSKSEMSRIFLLPANQETPISLHGILSKEDVQRVKSAYSAQYKGYVPGEVPSYIEDAFEAVFRITGSSKVRDDRIGPDKQKGIILWKGTYIDTPVYIELSYNTQSGFSGIPLMSAIAYGRELGEKIIDELRWSDREKLKNAGVTEGDINMGEKKGIFKHSTVDAIIKMARS